METNKTTDWQWASVYLRWFQDICAELEISLFTRTEHHLWGNGQLEQYNTAMFSRLTHYLAVKSELVNLGHLADVCVQLASATLHQTCTVQFLTSRPSCGPAALTVRQPPLSAEEKLLRLTKSDLFAELQSYVYWLIRASRLHKKGTRRSTTRNSASSQNTGLMITFLWSDHDKHLRRTPGYWKLFKTHVMPP